MGCIVLRCTAPIVLPLLNNYYSNCHSVAVFKQGHKVLWFCVALSFNLATLVVMARMVLAHPLITEHQLTFFVGWNTRLEWPQAKWFFILMGKCQLETYDKLVEKFTGSNAALPRWAAGKKPAYSSLVFWLCGSPTTQCSGLNLTLPIMKQALGCIAVVEDLLSVVLAK